MFAKVRVPVLGMIENMSFYCCPNCGHRAEIFRHGGAETTAANLDIPFLGAVPLDAAVCDSGEAGAPMVLTAPTSAPAKAFAAAAQSIWAQITRADAA